ncbi:hypothetical protein [Methylotuvimicrobium buryatense]|uniref:Uncharacterized protein n=1 Tax=Methylotuvimicrobium buryatense TaxID=95641 RepID=A0A4P9USA7_METBY|nr:hypothetical protein [Methylotuvimicrobium buryatense]QCW84409.1 hypothetical protein EQU24_20855 [Methylotuvimicrobium buryatense]
MLTRQSDVDELLVEAAELLQEIEGVYAGAIKNEDIIQIARPKVKSCLEHLRSCLDYVAADLSEITNSAKAPKYVYFPYGKDRKIYEKSLEKNLPDLHNKYKIILETIQPHKCGSNWLLHLCKTTNINKHTELQRQDRIYSENSVTQIGNLLKMEGSGSVTIGKLVIDGVHANPKGPLILTKEKPVKEIREEILLDIPIDRNYEWVKFVLKGTSLDIRELLVTAHSKISELVLGIYGA